MIVNWTYSGAHFALYTNTELLHCIPETNKMLCKLHLSKKTKIKKKVRCQYRRGNHSVCIWG